MSHSAENSIQRFVMTGGGITEGEHPVSSEAMQLFVNDLARVTGYEDEQRIATFTSASESASHPRQVLLPEGITRAVEEYPFSSVHIRRIGALTVRTIGFNAAEQASDFRDTSLHIGARGRLMIASRAIDPASKAAADLLYCGNRENAAYLSSMHSVAYSLGLFTDQVAALEELLDDAEGMDDVSPVSKNESGTEVEKVPELVFRTMGERNEQFKADITETVATIAQSIKEQFLSSFDDAVQHFIQRTGKSEAEVRNVLNTNSEIEAQTKSILRSVNLLMVTPHSQHPLENVMLIPRQLFDETIPLFGDKNFELPVEVGRDQEHGISVLGYKERILLLAPSPLEDYYYLQVYDEHID